MNFAPASTSGIAKAGLTTGVIGSALGVLNSGGLGGILGGMGNNWNGCSDNMPVTRYNLDKEQEIASLKSQIALRDANLYNDQKSLALYQYIDGKLNEVNAVLNAQAVQNQATKDSFQLLQERLECECNARSCADNAIVNYANATFYPKMVADVTTGTTTTAQVTYNPLPISNCGC